MKFAVIVFPGSNCDHDAHYMARSTCSGRMPSSSGTRRRASRAPTWSSCPAASRTATTCAPAPSRASRRSCRRWRSSPAAGGPVLGICNGFQVLLEAGLLPGRDAAQPRPQVSLRARPRPHRADRHAVHAARVARAGAEAADRPRRGQLLRRAGRDRVSWSRPGGSCSATATPRATSPTRPTRTARSTTSPASATRRATSSA